MQNSKKNMSLDWMKQTPIAHRGLHDVSNGRFENTLSAAKAAMDAGYSIELDVHPSSDMVPMVFHDDWLDRLTDTKGKFRDHSAKALASIHIGGTEDHVPTLRELLELVDGRVGLVIELKGIAGEDEGFVASVLSALDGYVGPMAIMSFDHWLLEEARTLNARMPVGLTAEGDESTAKAHADFCEKNGIEFVSYGMLDLPNSFVKSFRESGKPVIDWTVRSPEQAAFSYQHVDQITFEGFLA